MWSSLTAQAINNGYTTRSFFGSSENNTKAFGNNERDEFWGISKEEDKVIDAYVNELAKEIF
jgi:hypothetical protein